MITSPLPMRIALISLLFSLFAIGAIAQNNTGEIVYVDKVNIHKSLPPEMEAMKDRIPEFRESKKILYFNAAEALYINKPRDEADRQQQQEFRGEGRGRRGGGRFGGRNNDNKYYTNFAEGSAVDSRNFFGKDFLIEGSRESLKWKITGEQKQVGSYLCQKATFQDTSQSIEVWFTPMIPVSSGPDDYFGLPGMILHMDFDSGTRQITATDISLKALAEEQIIRPTKGKKVTRDEFTEIRDEKIKEMEEEFGGRPGGGGRFGRFRSGG